MNTKSLLSFNLYTCKELKVLCKQLGLKGYSKLLKAELVKILNEATNRATFEVSEFEKLCIAHNLAPVREVPVTVKSVKGSGQTVKEMQAYLKSNGVKGYSKLRKADLDALVAQTKALKASEHKLQAVGFFK